MAFEVRQAVSSDLDELARLWQERVTVYLKGEPRLKPLAQSAEEWRGSMDGWLENKNARVLVVDRDGQLIGYIVGWLWDTPPMFDPRRIGLVSEMSVDGHCKQGGVGTAMLHALKMWFKENKVDTVEVRVPRQQPIEQAFWRAVGASEYIDHLYFRLD